jgi:hypothetical protein
MTNRRGLLQEGDCYWTLQGFHIHAGDLELFLVSGERHPQGSPGWTASVKSLCLKGLEDVKIWDFNRYTHSFRSSGGIMHNMLSSVGGLDYLLSLPLEDKVFVSFTSMEGCHGQIICSGVEETGSEGRGRWISRFVPDNPEQGGDATVSRPGINENWHDCHVTGFLMEEDELQMFIDYYNLADMVQKGRSEFPLSGRITFKGVSSQQMSNFMEKNTLAGIDVEKKSDKTLVDFDCSIGCNGLITCREIEETSAMVHGVWKIVFEGGSMTEGVAGEPGAGNV